LDNSPLPNPLSPGERGAGVSDTSPGAYATIRGVCLRLDELTSPKLRDTQYLDSVRSQLQAAHPFAHVVVQDWFNPVLLELVRGEFPTGARDTWKTEFNQHARVERSKSDSVLGPASQLYFSILNSRHFVGVLSYLTGVADLLPDPYLVGGGLHETLPGGRFGIHTDFDRHPSTALHNEMIVITYLNPGWQPQWHGALELWDAKQAECRAKIEPEFGRTVLMLHGNTHFHGHSHPLTPPPGVTRKSVAAYYYSNRFAREDRGEPMVSNFLFPSRAERIKAIAKQWLPPVLLGVAKRWFKVTR
jgi:hypothetical protein